MARFDIDLIPSHPSKITKLSVVLMPDSFFYVGICENQSITELQLYLHKNYAFDNIKTEDIEILVKYGHSADDIQFITYTDQIVLSPISDDDIIHHMPSLEDCQVFKKTCLYQQIIAYLGISEYRYNLIQSLNIPNMTFSHGCCNVLDKKAHFDDKLLLVDFQHNYIYLYTFKDGAFMGFHCHYICHSNDVLYYVHHTLKLYDLSIQDTPIQLCGLIDLNSPYYITLNSY